MVGPFNIFKTFAHKHIISHNKKVGTNFKKKKSNCLTYEIIKVGFILVI